MNWQPIENAPSYTTDQVIIVWNWRLNEADMTRADGDFWRQLLREGSRPRWSHWMPLPERPKLPDDMTVAELRDELDIVQAQTI